MSEAVEARHTLDKYRSELDNLSRDLAELARKFEPVQQAVTDFCDEHELGLYQRSIDEDDFKLPSEKLRHKLAMRALDPALYGRFVAMEASMGRMRGRIGDLKVLVEAQRSVLSALKSEQEATQ